MELYQEFYELVDPYLKVKNDSDSDSDSDSDVDMEDGNDQIIDRLDTVKEDNRLKVLRGVVASFVFNFIDSEKTIAQTTEYLNDVLLLLRDDVDISKKGSKKSENTVSWKTKLSIANMLTEIIKNEYLPHLEPSTGSAGDEKKIEGNISLLHLKSLMSVIKSLLLVSGNKYNHETVQLSVVSSIGEYLTLLEKVKNSGLESAEKVLEIQQSVEEELKKLQLEKNTTPIVKTRITQVLSPK